MTQQLVDPQGVNSPAPGTVFESWGLGLRVLCFQYCFWIPFRFYMVDADPFAMSDTGLIGSTDFSGRGTTRAENAQGTPTQGQYTKIHPPVAVPGTARLHEITYR